MKLLVGIPTHKRPDLLRRCLASIAAQEGELPAVELFVADNDPVSRQGVAVVEELAAGFRFPVRCTVVAQAGISAVRNAILHEARRREVEFIAMIDDDETASPRWLVSLLAMQRETSANVVGGPVEFRFVSAPPPSIIDCGVFQKETRADGPTFPLKGSGNFLISMAALDNAGWPMFDSGFGLTGGGDTEWFRRLGNGGLTFAWSTQATASEDVPAERATRAWVLKRAYRAGNASMRIAMKHWPSRQLFDRIIEITLTFASAPLLVPLLLVPRRRLWLMRAWWTAAGGTSAIFGRRVHEYAGRHMSSPA